MTKLFKTIFDSSSDLQAIFRPFRRLNKISRISPDNKLINAYIFNWDNRVSEKNSLLGADVNFVISEEEGDKK